MANDVGELTSTGIRPLLDNINKAVDSFGSLLEEDAQVLTRELTALTLDLAQRAPNIADNIELLVRKMNESTDQFQAFLSPKNLDKLESILDNMETAADGFVQLTTDLKETAARPGQGLGLGRHGHRRQPPGTSRSPSSIFATSSIP